MRSGKIQISLNAFFLRALKWESSRYFLISGLALLFDLIVFSASVRIFDFSWYVAACLGFLAGVVVAYGLSISYVFSVRKLRHTPAMEISIFVGLGVLGLGVTQLVLYFCIEWLSWPAEVSKGVAAIVTFLTNFISRKVLLFK